MVEERHEPLIDSKSFAIVQDKLKSRQRPRQDGETSLFAGLIKCGECGKSLTIRTTHAKHPQQIYACATRSFSSACSFCVLSSMRLKLASLIRPATISS